MNDARGFTLIELMIVVAIMGMMVTCVADLTTGVTVPQMREQRTLAGAVDQQRLLAWLADDLAHARDVGALAGGAPGDVLVTSAFASRPDVAYVRGVRGLTRSARGRALVFDGQSFRGDVERVTGPGGVLVKLKVGDVVVSRFFPAEVSK